MPRLALIADLHGHLPPVPPCDVLVIAGDVCRWAPVGDQADWLNGELRAWLDAAPAAHVVAVAGNHDFVLATAPELVAPDLPWTYLQDAGADVAGLAFWGSPWTPWFHGWAFNAPQHDGEGFLADRFATAPSVADVLVLHGPPAGHGDRTTTGAHVGSSAELALIERVRPQVAVFGHIHEARGAWDHGPTRLVNAAAVDGAYELREDPFVLIDL